MFAAKGVVLISSLVCGLRFRGIGRSLKIIRESKKLRGVSTRGVSRERSTGESPSEQKAVAHGKFDREVM